MAHFQTYVFWPKNVGLKNEAIFGIPIVFYGFWVVVGGDALGGGPIELHPAGGKEIRG